MSERSNDTPTLGELIRLQREMSELPMRQLATMVGISGPYLSQIERNLREPSDRVLHSIAEQLQISADTLLSQSRRATADGVPETVAAIRRDKDLSPAQRKALEEMYQTFQAVTMEKKRVDRSNSKDSR
ncbi:helix-turn-helix domain-containing protein [Tomitella biformata]|uniref:helix-turn-helix domain-containing protein n=1 Tax=Tomitella biformata TaxID=630403 RepID=UPI000464387B|nr:helix-turn-helix transcriptional regulator [Tomitella biformata]